MSFTLANPTGWTTGDLLTETQINQLDAEHAAAIDGSGGGTYTLTAPLVIGGNSVEFQEDVYLGSAPGDDIVCAGNLAVSAPAVFSSTVGISGTVALSNNVTITDQVFITGASGSLVLDTGCHISGGAEGFLQPGVQGCVNKKVIAITSGTGDVSVDPEFYDTVLVSGISGDRTIVLGPPPANGYHMTISNYSTTQFVSFKPFGGSVFGNSLKALSGQFWLASLVWYSGTWYATSYSPYVP